MMTLQLRIGGILLAASRCGQETFDSIEEGEHRANARHSQIPKASNPGAEAETFIPIR